MTTIPPSPLETIESGASSLPPNATGHPGFARPYPAYPALAETTELFLPALLDTSDSGAADVERTPMR